jgi:pimeloyl-ACP methyl ester carboxylesterase
MRPIPIERRSLPRSSRSRSDDEGRCSRRASRVRREGARTPASEAEIAEYLDPWIDPGRSILADARGRGGKPLYSGDAAEGPGPIQGAEALGVGEDAPFQTVDYAERYAREIPETVLVQIKSAGHIPMKNAPKAVAGALVEFFVAERYGGYR